MENKIYQLRDSQGNNVSPVTFEKAVYDDNGNRLDTKLNEVAYINNVIETATSESITADRAIGDEDGNNIKETYTTKSETSNLTPTIGENGNWIVGGVDTGKPSKGADGVSLGEIELAQELSTDEGSENKVISQKVVSEEIEKINNIFYPDYITDNTRYDYSNTISELIIVAPVSEGYYLGIKCYNETLYVRPVLNNQSINYTWQSVTSISETKNNEVIELKCTTEGAGVSIGDTVGYIVFSDVDKIKTIQDSSIGRKTNSDAVSYTKLDTLIKVYLYLKYNYKIEDESITYKMLSPDLIEKLKTFISGETLEISKEYTNRYLNKNGGFIIQTTSHRAVAIYKIIPNVKINIFIPKNGNEYSTTYGYLVNETDDKVVIPSDGGIVGTETEINVSITTENYKYLAVCYSYDYGKPVITTEALGFQEILNLINSTMQSSVYTSGVDIYIPSEFIAVKNDTLQIFWRSVVKAINPYNFDIVSECTLGKSYPRYFSLPKTTIDSNIGQTVPIKIRVRNNSLDIISEKEANICIIDVPTSPVANKKVVCVGASATAGGQWAYELNRRLTGNNGDGTTLNPTGLGLTNINFVGRKTGTVKEIKLEATGGWSVQNYASTGRAAYRFYVSNVVELKVGDVYTSGGAEFTIAEINITEGSGNISCLYSGSPLLDGGGILTRKTGSGDESIAYSSYESETYNPFYNNETQKLDFKSYADKYCDGSIDIFVWHCGVNGIFGGTTSNITAEIDAYKKIIRAYHEDFPNGKMIISSVPIGSLTGGFGANYGASFTSNYYTFLNQAMNYAKELIIMCNDEEFSSFISYCPAMEEFDIENGYPYTDVAVNNRSTITEHLGTNGVHPTDSGYLMVADSFYRSFCDLLNRE